jgi:iron complex transport system substrate-binding protein
MSGMFSVKNSAESPNFERHNRRPPFEMKEPFQSPSPIVRPAWMILYLLLIAGFASTSCSNPKKKLVEQAPLISAKFTDDTGREIHLHSAPRKVVSIAPNITETIFAIGAQDLLAARSQACDYPPEAFAVPEITTFPSLDREELLATAADLILTTDEIFSPDDIAQLEKLGIPVYLQRYRTLADVYHGIRSLGEMLDRSAAANTLADSLANLEKKITQVTDNQVHYGTLILISPDPLVVAGGGGFLNELIIKAGGRNVFEKVEAPYHTTTVEEILSLGPEYLILPFKDPQIYSEILIRYPYLQNTPADINKQVFLADPDIFYRPGPRTIEALLELTHILHSQLNPQQFLNPDAL